MNLDPQIEQFIINVCNVGIKGSIIETSSLRVKIAIIRYVGIAIMDYPPLS